MTRKNKMVFNIGKCQVFFSGENNQTHDGLREKTDHMKDPVMYRDKVLLHHVSKIPIQVNCKVLKKAGPVVKL